MPEPQTPHVIILGCGRSGTSIFGELFDHLSPYSYVSEPLFGDYLQSDFERPTAVKVPAEDPRFQSTSGLSFPLDTLLGSVSGPKRFFWAVRHPLDTICSLRPGISNNWGHHPKPPDWQAWLERPLLERCAHHWNYLNSVGYASVDHLATPKRFEDMIHDPLDFANKVCEELELDPKAHASELDEWARRVQNTNNKNFVEAETSRPYSRPDHATRVARWKENLTPEQAEALIPMVKETASRFGYEL